MKHILYILTIIALSPCFASDSEDLESGPVRFSSQLNLSGDDIHKPIVINEAPPTGFWQRIRHSRKGFNLTNTLPSLAVSATALGIYVNEIASKSQLPHQLVTSEATRLVSNFQGKPIDWIVMGPQLVYLCASVALPIVSSDIRYKRLHQFNFGYDNHPNRTAVKIALASGTLIFVGAGILYSVDIYKYFTDVTLNLIESLPAEQATNILKGGVDNSLALLEKLASNFYYKFPLQLSDLQDLAKHNSGKILYYSEVVKNTFPSTHLFILSMPMIAILLNLLYAIVLF